MGKKEDDAVDEAVVQEIFNTLIDSFYSLPDDIMKSTKCPRWFYNAILRLVKAICMTTGVTKERLLKDLNETIWTNDEEEGEVLFEDKTLN